MIIASVEIFPIGPYTVQALPRPDNPAFSVFVVFRGATKIGRSFSRPDLDCCHWLEQHPEGSRYSETSAPLDYYSRGRNHHAK